MEPAQNESDALKKRIRELEKELALAKAAQDKPSFNALEEMLAPKPLTQKEYTPIYGDITQLNTEQTILQAVGKEVLHHIASDFMSLLETSCAVYEKNGDYAAGIFSSGWCRYLDEAAFLNCGKQDLKQALQHPNWHCHQSCWHKASLPTIEHGISNETECSGGIWLYAEPIMIGDEIIGSINLGYGNPPTDQEKLNHISEQYRVPVHELKRLSSLYKKRPPFIIDIAKDRLHRAAKMIAIMVADKRGKKLLEQAKQKADETELLLHAALDKSQEIEVIFNEFMKHSPIYVFFKDEEIRALHLSQNYEQMLGMPINQALGKTMDDLFPSDLAKKMIADDKQILQGSKVLQVQENLNGRYYNTIKFPISVDGKAVYLAGFTMDITEMKEVQLALNKKNEQYEAINKELRKANEELLSAKEKAEESDRLKSAFLQNMSHEIRTPMNAIMGFSELLTDPGNDDEMRKNFTQIILNSTKQLLSIVTDILTISAIDTKQEKIAEKETCVNHILLEMAYVFGAQAHTRNLALYAKQELDDKPSTILTDPTKLKQVFTNLIANALKFTHQGFVEFGYVLKNNQLVCFVKDTGIGIKKNTQEKIFARFRQADTTISGRYGGTGLGLSISKGFVELLGGKIWVESEPDKGAVFYFSLPYKPVYTAEVLAEEIIYKPTVLVAEDEAYNYLLLDQLLQNLGIKAIHAKNGQEAVDMCRANKNIVMVLMDIKMPVLDGYTAAKLIKELHPKLPIVAQSAYALECEIKVYEDTFDDYLTKPIKNNELEVVLKKYIKA